MINSTTQTVIHDGNGATVSFAYSPRLLSNSHLKVYVNGSEVVSGWAYNSSNSMVTFEVAPSNGSQNVVLTRVTTPTQSTTYPEATKFPSATVERDLDYRTAVEQDLSTERDRAIRIHPAYHASANDLRLAVSATNRANKFLAFDTNGAPIVASGTSANLGPVSAFMDTVLPSASAAAARTTLGVTRANLNIAPPIPTVRGLTGNRHATPTSFTLSGAAYVVFTNAVGESITQVGVTSLTVDATLSGPAENGRDQAGAFSNQWVHIYYIWNGSTVKLIASASAPPTGPTLPSGVTYFAYATSIYYATEFAQAYLLGNKVYTDIAAITGLTSTSVASIGSLTTQVPPVATHAFGWARMTGTSTAGGALDVTLSLFARNNSPVMEACSCRCYMTGINSQAQIQGDLEFICPLFTAQTIYYQVTNAAGTSPSGTVRIKGYVVPNGGDA